MVASSLETLAQIGALTPQFWPNPFVWSNYAAAWNQLPMGQFFVNSLLVATATTIGQLITSSMAAYAFARLRLRGRSVLFALYLATLIIPSQVTLIPNYLLIRFLHLHNTYTGLIAPFVVALASPDVAGRSLGCERRCKVRLAVDQQAMQRPTMKFVKCATMRGREIDISELRRAP